jgi:glutamyl-tRNA reductase
MGLFVIGLNHRTAPLAVRERLAIAPPLLAEHLGQMRACDPALEALLLSTCNRVELYGVRRDIPTLPEVRHYFGPAAESVPLEHFYLYTETIALEHLFRVAASLESMVVGEPEILGQLKQAFAVARAEGTVGPFLQRAVGRALSVAKRVRTETAIGRAQVSVARSGVQMARQIYGDLEGRRALLLGAGEVATSVARALLGEGIGELIVANRSFDKGAAFAGKFGGSAIPFDGVSATLNRVDIVVSSVAGTDVVLSAPTVSSAMRGRGARPLVLIDLGVPRNIAAEVNRIEGAYLFDIDDLSKLADEGRGMRNAAATEAEAIVALEVNRFCRQAGGVEAEQLIGAWSRRAEGVRLREIGRSKDLLVGLDPEQRKQLDQLTRSLVRKLLHRPFQALRSERAGSAGDPWGALRDALLEEDER